jgi:hypothetical protein
MWLFDEEKSMTNKEVVDFAKEGGDDAISHFPQHILDNKDNMLALVKNGFNYLALTYCSDVLKKDMDFLKQTASVSHYLFQDDFFNKIDPTLKNNKELLDIFATKVDDPYVKQISNEKSQLDKLLNKNNKQKTTHRI